MAGLPKLICVTPVKNEAWILERFLKLASLWADHIIIADQLSTDNSREIAGKYEKVILVNNPSEVFNEPERQQLLLAEARKIEGPKLIFTLDADECLTPNFSNSPEWETMLNSAPGTIFQFQLYNLQPGMKTMWADLHTYPLAYMDDGAEHQGPQFNSYRIPLPIANTTVFLNDIMIMHYSDTDWERYVSKNRWYNCYDKIIHPDKSSIDLFRQYNQRFFYPKDRFELIPSYWIEEYSRMGIDMTSVQCIPRRIWDEQILDFFDQYGIKYFKKERIWNVDWPKIATLHKRPFPEKYSDTRSVILKKIQTYLLLSQPIHRKSYIRYLDKLLQLLFRY